MTNEELDALVARLSEVGVYVGLSIKFADELNALRAERDAMAADIANLTASLAGEVEEVDRMRAEAAEARALAAETANKNYAEQLSSSVAAAEAAALERAVAAVNDWWKDWDGKTDPDCVIRAQFPRAARTALDAALADARKSGKLEGLREAAQMADDWFYDPQSDEVTDRRLGDTMRIIAARVEGEPK